MSLLIFILVLSFLVIIHELGHFVVARWSGIRVDEFGLGYPPRAKKLFTDKKGTEYTINWLPVGGFVRLYGEDGESTVSGSENEGAFFTKPVLKRLVVVLAGATVNFLFGIMAFGSIYSFVGIPTEYDYVLVEEVAAGSPAEVAGLKAGDKITGVVVEGEVGRVESVDKFMEIIGSHRGQWLDLALDGSEKPSRVYVRREEEVPVGQGSIGVVITGFGLEHYPMWQMPFRGMVVGVRSAVDFGAMLVKTLFTMVKDLILHGRIPEEVAGPVGIVHTVSREGILDEGILAIVNFAAILSINLAIINVLPIPALDGGRGLFLGIELLTRRRMKPSWERWLNTAGFAALMGLLVLVSIRDVMRLFQDESVRGVLSELFNKL